MRPAGRRAFGHVWSIDRRDRLPIVGLPALGFNFDDAQPVGEGWTRGSARTGYR